MTTLHRLFEAQVRARPDAIALRWQGRDVSYDALNRWSNRLAHAILGHGGGSDRPVLVAAPRSPAAIAAILAVLKAGAAYVPLDPDYPRQWRTRIARQCGARLVLGDSKETATEGAVRLDIDVGTLADQPDEDPDIPVTADSMMYVLFTSGTTGQPKGVMVSHGNVARLFPALSPHLSFGADEVWSGMHSHAFGFSVWETWGALAHGGRLVLAPPGLGAQPAAVVELLRHEGVTVLSQTPSAFRILARHLDRDTATLPDRLRLLAFSGEALEAAALERWFRRFGEERPALVNMYAATETSGEVSFRRLRRNDAGLANRIGIALPDTGLHVLDDWLEPMPDGETGELCVTGPAVAQGYWQDPELTASRFPECPEALGGGRLYRTGDLARRLADGSLELVGRADQEVKIQGYRVDPRLVSSTLLGLPGIEDAAVLADRAPGGETRLLAYCIATPGTFDAASVHEQLARHLPAYALPAALVEVDSFPLTPNGKLDEAALRERNAPGGGRVNDPEQLRSVLAEIWQLLLEVESVAPDDEFFALGGNSIESARLATEIEHRLGLRVNIADIFDHPRFADLLTFLAGHCTDAAEDDGEHRSDDLAWMRVVIDKAREAMSNGQPPYACCIVKDGQVLASVHNRIWDGPDATAHAEVEAIRQACRVVGRTDLSGCTLYSSCEPCSMCSGAIYWANIGRVVYAVRMEDERNYGLSEPTIPCRSMLEQLDDSIELLGDLGRREMLRVLDDWLKIRSVSV